MCSCQYFSSRLFTLSPRLATQTRAAGSARMGLCTLPGSAQSCPTPAELTYSARVCMPSRAYQQPPLPQIIAL